MPRKIVALYIASMTVLLVVIPGLIFGSGYALALLVNRG